MPSLYLVVYNDYIKIQNIVISNEFTKVLSFSGGIVMLILLIYIKYKLIEFHFGGGLDW